MLLQKKYCVNMRILNLFQDLLVSCLEVLVGGGGGGGGQRINLW